MDKIFINENQLKRLCEWFCIKVLELKKKYKTIVLVTKWGLVPWYYIANRLWIKDIRTIGVSSYENESQSYIEEHYRPDLDNTDDILIFDELTDTWKTLEYIKEKMPKNKNIDFWTLFRYKRSSFMPDIWFLDKSEEWITFHYEVTASPIESTKVLEIAKWHFES